MRRAFYLLLALLPTMAQAVDLTPEDIGQAVAKVYFHGGHAALLQLERDCWKAPAAKSQPGVCVRMVVAGGLIDTAMQRNERRGAMPAFTPQAQRARVFAAGKKLGHNEAAMQAVMEQAVGDVPGLLAGLMQAGMR